LVAVLDLFARGSVGLAFRRRSGRRIDVTPTPDRTAGCGAANRERFGRLGLPNRSRFVELRVVFS
jgi:hypothetical protein